MFIRELKWETTEKAAQTPQMVATLFIFSHMNAIHN